MSKQYFLVRNFVTGEYLDLEFDDYYTTFGELSGATVFDDELYSYLTDEYKKDTQKVYIHLVDDYLKKIISDLEAKLAESESRANDWKQRFESSEERFKTFNSNGVTALNLKNEKIDQLKQQLEESNESHHKNIVELTKIATEKDRKIEKLKQQLAESEKELNDWKDGTIICKWTDAENKVKELEQQISEKEKEIEWYDKAIKNNIVKGFDLEERHNQDKISFAVEQLEKVKENLIEDLFDLYRSPCLIYETYGDEYDSVIQDAINNTIDNQIKQLKEGM